MKKNLHYISAIGIILIISLLFPSVRGYFSDLFNVANEKKDNVIEGYEDIKEKVDNVTNTVSETKESIDETVETVNDTMEKVDEANEKLDSIINP